MLYVINARRNRYRRNGASPAVEAELTFAACRAGIAAVRGGMRGDTS